jgi:hypothetical protein
MEKRQQAQTAAEQETASAAVGSDSMPEGMWVHELIEILGERCCRPERLTAKRRRSGPRDSYQQEFLVRGTFLEDDGDEGSEEDEEDVPEPNTYWVTQDDLLQTIEKSVVLEHLHARQDHVKNGLEEA